MGRNCLGRVVKTRNPLRPLCHASSIVIVVLQNLSCTLVSERRCPSNIHIFREPQNAIQISQLPLYGITSSPLLTS